MANTQKILIAGVFVGLLITVVAKAAAAGSVDANIGAGLLAFAGLALAGVCAISAVISFVLGRRNTKR